MAEETIPAPPARAIPIDNIPPPPDRAVPYDDGTSRGFVEDFIKPVNKGIGETMLSGASGATNWFLTGLMDAAGIVHEAGKGVKQAVTGEPINTNFVNRLKETSTFGEEGTYKPQTEAGKRGTEAIALPFEKTAQWGHEAKDFYNKKAEEEQLKGNNKLAEAYRVLGYTTGVTGEAWPFATPFIPKRKYSPAKQMVYEALEDKGVLTSKEVTSIKPKEVIKETPIKETKPNILPIEQVKFDEIKETFGKAYEPKVEPYTIPIEEVKFDEPETSKIDVDAEKKVEDVKADKTDNVITFTSKAELEVYNNLLEKVKNILPGKRSAWDSHLVRFYGTIDALKKRIAEEKAKPVPDINKVKLYNNEINSMLEDLKQEEKDIEKETKFIEDINNANPYHLPFEQVVPIQTIGKGDFNIGERYWWENKYKKEGSHEVIVAGKEVDRKIPVYSNPKGKETFTIPEMIPKEQLQNITRNLSVVKQPDISSVTPLGDVSQKAVTELEKQLTTVRGNLKDVKRRLDREFNRTEPRDEVVNKLTDEADKLAENQSTLEKNLFALKNKPIQDKLITQTEDFRKKVVEDVKKKEVEKLTTPPREATIDDLPELEDLNKRMDEIYNKEGELTDEDLKELEDIRNKIMGSDLDLTDTADKYSADIEPVENRKRTVVERRAARNKIAEAVKRVQKSSREKKAEAVSDLEKIHDEETEQEKWDRVLAAEGLGEIEPGRGRGNKRYDEPSDFGFMGSQHAHRLYEAAVQLLKENPTVQNLTRLGKNILLDGVKTFKDFTNRVKTATGELFGKVKDFLRDAWNDSKAWLKDTKRGIINVKEVDTLGLKPTQAKIKKAIERLKNQQGEVGKDITKPFYSKLEEVVNSKMSGSMNPEQLVKMLKNNGVTDAEIKNVVGNLVGISDFETLAHKDIVTKQDVLDAIKVNTTKFEDVVLGEDVSITAFDKANRELRNDPNWVNLSSSQQQAAVQLIRQNHMPTHYEQYSEPGYIPGSYREMFVTAPRGSNNIPTWEEYKSHYTKFGRDEDTLKRDYQTSVDNDYFTDDFLRMSGKDRGWQDGHSAYSNIQNPIVRIRYNDREVNGKKILFVEEMQGPAGDTKWTGIVRGKGQKGDTFTEGKTFVDREVFDTKQQAQNWIDERKSRILPYTIDESSIEKTVQGEQGKMPPWLQARIYDIGVKRVLALAKEKGYDGVAWTSGEMQVKRYEDAIVKNVDKVDWGFVDGKKLISLRTPANQEVNISINDSGLVLTGPKEFVGNHINKVVGDDLGPKILKESSGDVRGVDIKIGGEGLKKLYDQQIPSLFKKYGKEGVDSINITPEGKSIEFNKLSQEAQDLIWKKEVENEGKYKFNEMEKFINPELNKLGYKLKIDDENYAKYYSLKNEDTSVPYTPITSKTPSSFTMYSDPFGVGAGINVSLDSMRSASKDIKSFVDYLKSNKQIVDNFDPSTSGDNLPVRQEVSLSKDKPTLQRTKDTYYDRAKLLSPHFTFRDFFNLKDNPVIDMISSHMASITNIRNAKVFLDKTLTGVDNNFRNIVKDVKPLFNKHRELIQQFTNIENEISSLKKEQDSLHKGEAFDNLTTRIEELKSQKKTLEGNDRFKQLKEDHEALMKSLAEKYPDARVYLAAADELPEGIKLSSVEQHAVDQLKKYTEETGKKLESLRIPIIKGKEYMPRLFRQLLDDNIMSEFVSKYAAHPDILSFMSRLPGSKTWLPSAHESMKLYIPAAEYKIAYQPFLNRWRTFVDTLEQPELKKFMNDWISKNVTARNLGIWDKALNAATSIEYARLIGLSLSVGTKHIMKIMGTPAEYGFMKTIKAVPQVVVIPFQSGIRFGSLHFDAFRKFADKLGVKGEQNQLSLFNHYVTQSDLVRMITEIPEFEKLDGAVFGSTSLEAVKGSAKAAWKTISNILSQPVRVVEAMDNAVSITAGVLAGKSKGIDPAIIERRIWETILDVNFRAGADQPLIQKGAGARTWSMFQMTPAKLQERLYKWAHDSVVINTDPVTGEKVIGKRDAFGTLGSSKLARYLLMVGAAELLARENDTSVIGMTLAHMPFIGELVESTKEGVGFKFKEPKFATSPIIQLAMQLHDKGFLGGIKEHYKTGFNFADKIKKASTEEYPTRYDSATKYMFGLPKVQGENDLETVIEKQKEQRKELKEDVTELASKVASGTDEEANKALDRAIEIKNEFETKAERDAFDKRFVAAVKLHQTSKWKWWSAMSGLSPENKAKVFYEKFSNATDEQQEQMLKDAKILGGYKSDRFKAALKREVNKSNEKKEENKDKFSIRSIFNISPNPATQEN